MLYGFDDIQNKLMHLNHDFEIVNCPYSYFKVFIILSDEVVYIHGNFLKEPLLLAINTIVYIEAKNVSCVYFGDGLVGKKETTLTSKNSCPRTTITSLINVVQMQIVVVTPLVGILQQHSSSEVSTITPNDMSTKPSNFPLQAYLANFNQYFCSLPTVQLLLLFDD